MRETPDRILDAAERCMNRYGLGVSMRDVATEAGLSRGSLYRYFGDRETLVEATYRNETARLCAAAPELLEILPAAEALRAWMDYFVDYMATKHGMADALKEILATEGDLRMANMLDIHVEQITPSSFSGFDRIVSFGASSSKAATRTVTDTLSPSGRCTSLPWIPTNCPLTRKSIK